MTFIVKGLNAHSGCISCNTNTVFGPFLSSTLSEVAHECLTSAYHRLSADIQKPKKDQP